MNGWGHTQPNAWGFLTMAKPTLTLEKEKCRVSTMCAVRAADHELQRALLLMFVERLHSLDYEFRKPILAEPLYEQYKY